MKVGGYVYIAGRYGDYDGWLAIEDRIARARQHAAALARAGIPYFSPHLNSAHFEVVVPDVPREFWLRLDDTFLHDATALLVVTAEALHSTGVKRDVAIALALKMPIYKTDTIPDLIEDWPGLCPPTVVEEPPAWTTTDLGRITIARILAGNP